MLSINLTDSKLIPNDQQVAEQDSKFAQLKLNHYHQGCSGGGGGEGGLLTFDLLTYSQESYNTKKAAKK